MTTPGIDPAENTAKLADTMVIDCHVHAPNDLLQDMLHEADRAGVDQLCVFGLGNEMDPEQPSPSGHWPSTGGPHQRDRDNPPPERITASNTYICSLLDEAPERLHALCFVNPRHTRHALEEIQRFVAKGPMRGIKLWIACKASDPLVEPVAAAAADHGVPLLQHCWAKYPHNLPHESTPEDVAVLANKFPGLRLIAAHMSGQQEEGILALAPYENVYLDTSGMLADAGMLEFAVATVGAERILFGSDAPLRQFAPALARIDAAALNDAQRKAIRGENFKRLFSL